MGTTYFFSFTYLVLLLVQGYDCYSLSEGSSTTRGCSSSQYIAFSGTWSCGSCSGSASVTSRMNSQCGYGSSCTIQANNAWLGGDPCKGCDKTLIYSYSCSFKNIFTSSTIDRPCQRMQIKLNADLLSGEIGSHGHHVHLIAFHKTYRGPDSVKGLQGAAGGLLLHKPYLASWTAAH
ncbi:uncharacterized protein LOC134245601, partial [Saccostrea cucullata]|uniref:uncharacterized protein LOC134245601 n=1 Tax=Saccostrea cuccullata TaxID=36930 RepID=UPI002ED01486